ncbi:MAG: bifunctional glutamate N-acetyltransferase/amino-acid acetyltransferase ArgJ [Roseiflexaceae bacterium]|nr:bifunctional glutamate N-acetyltransferase/amino-acid acetyltransferase ArgJ [Roseiflexaceae bacterium]
MTVATDIDSFVFAPGFSARATACGLKTSSVMGASDLDLALIATETPCSAAGIFTTNKVKAAPVLYDQEVLAQQAHAIRAVITNAGCANACTGPQGMANTRQTAALVAERIGCAPEQVLVLSTGVIGRQLPMEKLSRGIEAVTSSEALVGAPFVARAIMTTDTKPKVASATITLAGGSITIAGCCKGAGMIHPNMATMLAIVTTDAQIEPALLDTALRRAANTSFNRISVDGDTSTNDTLFLLASGASDVKIGEAELDVFAIALSEVCTSLAKQVARDGEGATRLIEINVTGARDEAEAHTVANSIATSPLFKCAVHGGDPNWGRVLCAAGYSGADIDQNKLALTFGPADRYGDNDSPAVQVVANGLPLEYEEREAAATLKSDPVLVRLDLGQGSARATVWTCDMSAEYVEINAHYTS